MAHEVWEEYYDRLAALIGEHRTTLVFVNTRRLAERVARHLSERLGEDASHGASRQPVQGTAPRCRASAEDRRAEGARRHGLARARHRHRPRRSRLPDRIAAPHRDAAPARRTLGPHDLRHTQGSHAAGVARRSGRMRGASSRVRRGDLDRIVTHDAPLDVLAQQVTAETSCRAYGEDELFGLIRRAWPYRTLARARFRCGRLDGRRWIRDAARPPRRARPSRRGERHAARPPRIAPACH